MDITVTVSRFDEYIWASGATLQTTLCAVLVWRRMWKHFPVFTFYVAYDLLQSALLLSVFTRVINKHYEQLYWITTVIEYAVVLAVIIELSRAFFFIHGTWVPGVRAYVAIVTIGMVVLSAGVSLRVSPPNTVGYDLLALRGTLFISLLVCGLFAGISSIASTLITTMPTSTWAVWVGFVVSSGSVMLQTINSVMFGWHHGDRRIDHCVNGIILCVLAFWIFYFSTRIKPLRLVLTKTS